MQLDFADYRIITDSQQFIVQAKKIVEESKLTKEENIGKERLVDIAYCPSLKFALKYINTKVLLDNDDLILIIQKLNEIEDKITEFLKMLKQEGR